MTNLWIYIPNTRALQSVQCKPSCIHGQACLGYLGYSVCHLLLNEQMGTSKIFPNFLIHGVFLNKVLPCIFSRIFRWKLWSWKFPRNFGPRCGRLLGKWTSFTNFVVYRPQYHQKALHWIKPRRLNHCACRSVEVCDLWAIRNENKNSANAELTARRHEYNMANRALWIS
jgi:hypothetical protein